MEKANMLGSHIFLCIELYCLKMPECLKISQAPLWNIFLDPLMRDIDDYAKTAPADNAMDKYCNLLDLTDQLRLI